MTNTDLARLLKSDEIQSALRAPMYVLFYFTSVLVDKRPKYSLRERSVSDCVNKGVHGQGKAIFLQGQGIGNFDISQGILHFQSKVREKSEF